MTGFSDVGIRDAFVYEPQIFGDSRGYFCELYRESLFEQRLHGRFVQFNQSRSTAGVLRGLHLQVSEGAAAKWVECLVGSIWDVCVDLRPDSPTFKKWVGVELNEDNHRGFYIPPGCGHGFCVLGQTDAVIRYAQTNYYLPSTERALLWNDATINIEWPIEAPKLSDKDANASAFETFQWDECRGLLKSPGTT